MAMVMFFIEDSCDPELASLVGELVCKDIGQRWRDPF